MTHHASLNRSFRLVRRADAQVVPVPETARGHGAGRAVKTAVAVAAATTVALAASAAPPPAATQLPGGGSLAAGQANWQAQGATLTVNQGSQRAVIDWQSFNLGSQATIVFNQAAGRAGATLNRVLDSQPSQILGRIQAPGQVFISNPAGVIFGSSARVDVGGLVATSMSLGAADFMAGAMNWQRNDATGAVVNSGVLTAADGGFVALMAPEVRNEGVIVARAGTVALLAGEAIRLEFEGTGLSGVQVSPAQLKTLIENRNAILAPGGLVILSARSADALRSGVVNQAGVIDAGSLVSRGGRVLLEGDDITLAAGSRTDAAGATGGGTVLVGGDWQGGGTMHQAAQVTMQAGAGIDVSATQQGDGGKAVLWSDTTRAASLTTVRGTIAANSGAQGGDGGRIETSGHRVETTGSRVSASAVDGKSGLWLIDPTDITIGSTQAAGYVTALQGGTNVLVQTAPTGTDAGDITVASEIAWGNNATSTLTLSAARNININAPITVLTPNGGLALEYGQGAVAAGNTSRYTVNAPVTLPAGQHFGTKLGSDGTAVPYTVITALGTAGDTSGSTLQGISGSLTGRYVLGTSIDASATATWNSGAGFTPIGDGTTAFTGTLDGLGNSVLNLNIALPTQSYVGLIGALGTGGIVRNVGVANASISAQSNVGALVGQNKGAISDAYSSGSVGVSGILGGGLVGDNTSGSITESYSNAIVNGAAALQVGGLAGNNGGAISYSYASGDVTGHSHTGGLVGYQNGQGAGATIVHSYAGGGHVTGTGGAYIGALTGYANGNGVSTSAGGVNITSAGTFAGWDFTNTWTAYNGRTTPLLSAFLRPVTVGAASVKTYDGNLTVDPGSIVVSDPTLAGALLGSLTYSGGASPGAGTYSGVTLGGLFSNQQGARIAYAGPGSLTINPAALTVAGATATSKVYDGTNAASVTGASLSGAVGGDNVSLSSAGATFSDKNVGSAKPVTAAYTLTGSAAGNYTLAQPTGLTANITPAALTLTGAVAAGKVYDGTTTGSVTGASLSGVVNGDSVGLIASASFADKNVGSAKAVHATIALSGADAVNYTVAQPTGLTADITPALLSLSGAVAAGKVYDGTTTASVSGGTLGGVLNGDSVGLMPAASFADKNVGMAKPVTAAYTLTGTGAGNYTLAQPAGLVADITPASLTVVGGVAAGKVYDGTTTASVTGASLSGVVGGDSVGLVSSASFADRNVGIGKVVTATVALSGADAGNYIVAQPTTLAADITQLGSVAWVGGASGDWFAAGNWAGGAVPTLSNVANVTIPANAVATLANASGSNAPALASLTGAGGVQLSQASLTTTGAVALDNVAIGSGATLAAGSLSTSHYNQSGGSVAVAGAFAVNGSFVQTGGSIRAGGAASVSQAAGDLGVQHLVGSSVALAAAQGDLNIANVGSVGDASLAASGSITQAAGGSLTVLGKANMVAGGDVAVDQARNMVVGSVSVQAHDVRLAQGLDDLVLGNVSASGNVTLTAAAGNIRQADATALTVSGTTSAAATQGSVYLQAANNAFGGAVSASATDIAVTQGATPLMLGSVAAGRNLAIVSGGNVTQTGALTVAGKASIDAGTHDVTLASTSNDFAGNLAVRAGALTLTDGIGGLLLGNLQTGGATLVQSLDGPILQTAGARFVSTASSTPSFSAWLAGAYTSVSLNTDVTTLINGQLPGAASIGSGVASALSLFAASAVNAFGSEPRTVTKARSLVIPMASQVAEE